jgi:hypothetical protein
MTNLSYTTGKPKLSGVKRIASNEATDMKWFTLEELKRLGPTFEEDAQIIEKRVKS